MKRREDRARERERRRFFNDNKRAGEMTERLKDLNVNGAPL